MTGPFYKKDSDGQYKLAPCCKECAFCDEETNFCCLNPCTYFDGIKFEEDELSDGNSEQ